MCQVRSVRSAAKRRFLWRKILRFENLKSLTGNLTKSFSVFLPKLIESGLSVTVQVVKNQNIDINMSKNEKYMIVTSWCAVTVFMYSLSLLYIYFWRIIQFESWLSTSALVYFLFSVSLLSVLLWNSVPADCPSLVFFTLLWSVIPNLIEFNCSPLPCAHSLRLSLLTHLVYCRTEPASSVHIFGIRSRVFSCFISLFLFATSRQLVFYPFAVI